MRGVGVMPPYTPKSPQPTLSSRTNTMFGLSPDAATGCCACATCTGFTDAATDTAAKAVPARSTLRRLGVLSLALVSTRYFPALMDCPSLDVSACSVSISIHRPQGCEPATNLPPQGTMLGAVCITAKMATPLPLGVIFDRRARSSLTAAYPLIASVLAERCLG